MKFKAWQCVKTNGPYEDIPIGTVGVISGTETDGEEIIGYFIDIVVEGMRFGCTIGPIPEDYLDKM